MTEVKTKKQAEATTRYILVRGTYARARQRPDDTLIIHHPGEILELTDSIASTMRDKILTPEQFEAKSSEFAEKAAEQKAEEEEKKELEEDAKGDPEVEARRRVIDDMQAKIDGPRRIM